MINILDKLFLIREIRSKKGKLHFRRWRIVDLYLFSIYIHGIYHHDEDEHLHNHPWNMFNMILHGSYTELTNGSETIRTRFTVGYMDTKAFHKIKKLHTEKVFSIAIVGKRKKDKWGYIVDGNFTPFDEYRIKKNT